MCKKKWIYLACVLLIAVIVFAVWHSQKREIVYLEEPDPNFYPSDYDFVLSRFEEDTSMRAVRPIRDYKDAVRGFRTLLRRHNCLKLLPFMRLTSGDTITVFYVPEEDTWVITGSCPCKLREGDPHWVGCQPATIIRPDGTVVAVGSY